MTTTQNKSLHIRLKNPYIYCYFGQFKVFFKSKELSININNLLIFIHILKFLNDDFFYIIINNSSLKEILEKTFPNEYILIDNFTIPCEEINNIIKKYSFKNYTLTFIIKNNFILLGRKKRGFGKDYYNGFGGKVQQKERIIEAAKREVWEECSLLIDNLVFTGNLYFIFRNCSNPNIKGYVFYTKHFKGKPLESEEMIPRWFYIPSFISLDNIKSFLVSFPFDKMWKDDIFWFPYFINHHFFKGFFELDENNHLISFLLEIKDSRLIPKCYTST